MLLIHLVCLAISCGIAYSCKCGVKNQGDDCLCDGSKGRRCNLYCGDCDVDEDCMENLVCGTNNCRFVNWKGKGFPMYYDKWDDCCKMRGDRTWIMENGGIWHMAPGDGERRNNRTYDKKASCRYFS
eukprot:GFUD01138206.1.p1 GENE.GFUD01138206.1~~GFUD01138206.1.p1  ORF type:complete len:127 (+),score=3.36 GFUD01138206.1:52-432(+)